MLITNDEDNNFTTAEYSFSNDSNAVQNYINGILIFLLFIFICGVIFNIISIIAILKIKKKLQPINILILNLALADIIYATGIPMFVSNEFNQRWPFGLIGCRIFFLTDYIGMIVGVYSVVALSVERYIEVTDKKKRLEQFGDKFKVVVTFFYILFVWLFAIIFALPMVTSVKAIKFNKGLGFTCESTWNDLQLNIFFVTKYIFLFIIPFTIILLSSLKLVIFLNVWKKRLFKFKKINKFESSTKFELTSRNNDPNLQEKSAEMRLIDQVKSYDAINTESSAIRRRSDFFIIDQESKKKNLNLSQKRSKTIRLKAIKIVLSIVLLFFLQWTPLWVFELYRTLCNDYIENIHLINSIITLISYSNSISNPLLYIFLTVSFQKFISDLTNSIRFKK